MCMSVPRSGPFQGKRYPGTLVLLSEDGVILGNGHCGIFTSPDRRADPIQVLRIWPRLECMNGNRISFDGVG